MVKDAVRGSRKKDTPVRKRWIGRRPIAIRLIALVFFQDCFFHLELSLARRKARTSAAWASVEYSAAGSDLARFSITVT